MNDAPCLGCMDRKPGCHNSCMKYLRKKAVRDIENIRRAKEAETMDAMGSLEVRRSKRVGKSRKRHSA